MIIYGQCVNIEVHNKIVCTLCGLWILDYKSVRTTGVETIVGKKPVSGRIEDARRIRHLCRAPGAGQTRDREIPILGTAPAALVAVHLCSSPPIPGKYTKEPFT